MKLVNMNIRQEIYYSMYNSVCDSVYNSVGTSVHSSARGSVWLLVSGLVLTGICNDLKNEISEYVY